MSTTAVPVSTIVTLCTALHVDPSCTTLAAQPVWFRHLVPTHGLDTTAVNNPRETYLNKLYRALLSEQRRQRMHNVPAPHHFRTLTNYIVIPLEQRQSFAANYGGLLETLLDLFLHHFFEETMAAPAANITLSELSTICKKVPGISSSALTVFDLEPPRGSGHGGINVVLNEVIIHFLSGTAESGEQRFYSITWENNHSHPSAQGKYGNTAACLFHRLVAEGVPIGKTELQIISRWHGLINNTASSGVAEKADHARDVAAVFTRSGSVHLDKTSFATLKPILNEETGLPIATNVPLPGPKSRQRLTEREFRAQGGEPIFGADADGGECPPCETNAGRPFGGGGGSPGKRIDKPTGALINLRGPQGAIACGRIRAWNGTTMPPFINPNRACGRYGLDCPRCGVKETLALENKAKGVTCELSIQDFVRVHGGSPGPTLQPSKLGVVVLHGLEECYHIKMDIVFHVKDNPSDAHFLESESHQAYGIKFKAALQEHLASKSSETKA